MTYESTVVKYINPYYFPGGMLCGRCRTCLTMINSWSCTDGAIETVWICPNDACGQHGKKFNALIEADFE